MYIIKCLDVGMYVCMYVGASSAAGSSSGGRSSSAMRPTHIHTSANRNHRQKQTEDIDADGFKILNFNYIHTYIHRYIHTYIDTCIHT